MGHVKSMVELAVEGRSHMVLSSSKYHAECAGQGIEYDFARCKWWYKSNSTHSTAGLLSVSLASFGPLNVTLRHTRKFARRNRDYMRSYRGGALGLDADSKVKVCKAHRCALDTDYAFISGA